MNGLFVLYSALAVFGIGVTVIDFLGVFDQAGEASASESDAGSSGDSGSSDDGGSDGLSGDDGSADQPGPSDEPGGEAEGGHAEPTAVGRGSHIASVDSAARAVSRAIGALRLGVYFSLGAGPTGLFATLTGVAPIAGLAWSAGAGVFIALLAKALRRLVRRDLDSSIRPEEYLLDEAVVTVSVGPGALGKAMVRRYGREAELYVRGKDQAASFPKGTRVRIADLDDGFYWIEAL